jgi:pimeloyl-ACP methyl ester carboxylesterase
VYTNTSGHLQTWSVLGKLDRITCPTLLFNSLHDQAQDIAVLPLFHGINKVKWVKFTDEGISHTPFIEHSDVYLKELHGFLAL